MYLESISKFFYFKIYQEDIDNYKNLIFIFGIFQNVFYVTVFILKNSNFIRKVKNVGKFERATIHLGATLKDIR